MKYVIDASVAVKWVIKEPFYEEARHFLDNRFYKKVAPSIYNRYIALVDADLNFK